MCFAASGEEAIGRPPGKVRFPPMQFSNGSSVAARFMSDIDAFGCLRSLRARAALDGVSWVRSGSVEIAVDRSD